MEQDNEKVDPTSEIIKAANREYLIELGTEIRAWQEIWDRCVRFPSEENAIFKEAADIVLRDLAQEVGKITGGN